MVGREMDRDQTRVMDSVLAGLGGPAVLAYAHPMLPHSPWYLLLRPAVRERCADPRPRHRHLVGRSWLVDQAGSGTCCRRATSTGCWDARSTGSRRPGSTTTPSSCSSRITVSRSSRASAAAARPSRTSRTSPSSPLMKAPQVEDRVDDRHVRTIDVLPTVADLLGMTLPADADGRSMLAPNYRATREVRVFRRAGEAPVGRPFASVLAQRGATLRRQTALVGSARGPSYRAGPNAGLLGRAPGELVVRDREDERNARPARPPRGVRPQGRALSVARERAAGRRGARERPAPARRLGERAHRGGDEDVSRRGRRCPLLGARARVGLPAGREPGGRLRRLGGRGRVLERLEIDGGDG